MVDVKDPPIDQRTTHPKPRLADMPRIEKLNSFYREPLSEPARQLLCDFAAADPERPLRRVDADWEEVFQGVCRNGLVGLTHWYLKQQESPDYPPAEFRQWVKQAHIVEALRLTALYRHVRRVLAGLSEAGVEYLVLKGPALAHLVYPDPALRSFSDLDVVVRERDHERARRRLVEMGFDPAEDRPQLPPKLARPIVPHGSNYWYRNGQERFLVELHYEDLLESGLASRDAEGFWRRAVVVDIAGVPAKVLSLEDQIVCLSAHVHYHGYTRLNWLSDIALIVRDWAAELDWARLIETVRVEEAQVPVYYTLRLVDRLLVVSAPHAVLDALRPDRLRRWLHERYTPEDQLLSLQPMAYPAYSFHFVPLFNRLIPDLLVMGRRKEKLACLLRLLVPPAAWLRDYYHAGDHDSLAVHYLLHPIKLAFHYLSEVVIAADRFRRKRRLSDGEIWWCFAPPPIAARHPLRLLERLTAFRSRLAPRRWPRTAEAGAEAGAGQATGSF